MTSCRREHEHCRMRCETAGMTACAAQRMSALLHLACSSQLSGHWGVHCWARSISGAFHAVILV
jgi:hypothetical protein